ncbi:flagellar biosynthesis protein FlgA, partial [Pseudomonas simiae]
MKEKRKGEKVENNERRGENKVKMKGEEKKNGGMREQIRVKNLNSNRVIKAR